MSEWISFKERPLKIGEYSAMIRYEYPSFCWVGKYSEPADVSDIPDYYILLPDPPINPYLQLPESEEDE